MAFNTIAMAEKPHAVCVPFPAQGHINPMLNLAKLLHYKGFYITFVNTEYNHKRLLKSRGPDSLRGLPDFYFETIPDGLPPSDNADITQDVPSLLESVSMNFLDPFRDLLHKLNHPESANAPTVTCIVSDSTMTFTRKAAREFGVPNVSLATHSACSNVCYAMLPRFVEQGLTPIKDGKGRTKEYLDTVLNWISGIKTIRFKHLPSYFTEPNDRMRNCLLKLIQDGMESNKPSALVFNTFDSLDQDALNVLSAVGSTIYTIGPVHLLNSQIQEDDKLEQIASNLWIEQTECIEWLDSKEPNSVLYANFGSVAVLKPEQVKEIAWGLANSKKQFLWIIRPDLVTGNGTILPTEFVSETKDRGLLASWCPQQQVLTHPSIKGFLSHMGWNSTIESISAGVPMICLPCVADQQTNCGFACNEWGIGMEIDENVKRDEVEMLVRELMEGEKGVELKAKAMEWKKKAEEACKPGGSSFQNLDKLIADVLLSNKKTTKLT